MPNTAWTRLAFVLPLLAMPLALSGQTPRPETHTVRPGDTLWDLAHQYLGDPFLWPEIYRLNTNVVEDPHWIYPDEVLRLAPGADVSAVPSVDTPPPDTTAVAAGEPVEPDSAAGGEVVEAAAPDTVAVDEALAEADLGEPQAGDLDLGGDDRGRNDAELVPLVGQRTRVDSDLPNLELRLERNYRAVRRSEFYSSGWLTEGREMPVGRLLGLTTPLQIKVVTNSSSAQLYNRVAVAPPARAKYQVGDTLLTIYIGRDVPGHGRVVIPTGLLRVIDVSRPEVQAEVIALYGDVVSGQAVLPVEKFVDPGNVRPVPVTGGLTARVVTHRDKQPLTGMQDVLFLDRGRRHGVGLGDIFEIRQRPRKREGAPTLVNEYMATVQVVHLGERTATVRVNRVSQPDIIPGTEARQIAKLPS